MLDLTAFDFLTLTKERGVQCHEESMFAYFVLWLMTIYAGLRCESVIHKRCNLKTGRSVCNICIVSEYVINLGINIFVWVCIRAAWLSKVIAPTKTAAASDNLIMDFTLAFGQAECNCIIYYTKGNFDLVHLAANFILIEHFLPPPDWGVAPWMFSLYFCFSRFSQSAMQTS